jgi:hypothetical protein
MTKFKKTLLVSLFFKFITLFLFSYHLEQAELDDFSIQGKDITRADVMNFFSSLQNGTQPFLGQYKIVTNPMHLQLAAKDALNFFKNPTKKNRMITEPKAFGKHVLSSAKTKETLEFIINVIENDKKHKRRFRILDSKFLKRHFRFIKWSGDVDSAPKGKCCKVPHGKIKLTEYAVFMVRGSYYRTKDYPYALYAMVDKNFIKKERFKYTKQDIVTKDPLKCVFNKSEFKNKVKPLVWLSRESLEETMMQGTAIIKMPDQRQVMFTVSKNNGIAYDTTLKDRKQQKRYWYFKGVGRNRFGKDKTGVVFAGDLYNIGLGKIIAIKYQNNITKKKEIRLGVLSDFGGAFTNNLYQLDLFSGIFKKRWEFNKWKLQFPNFVEAYVLVRL